jgi:LDH2 family malate/lactate/ureidoglycolate dehydrogenase
MCEATRVAVGNARQHGICIGGLHGVASTTGAIGFWAREISRSGLVGIVCSQSPELVAPHGSALALLGTNPIAFGFPRQHLDGHLSTLVIDVATSAIAFYAVVAAKAAGEQLPLGVAINDTGQLTTLPAEVAPPDHGALLPFGGTLGSHKGSALALAVELLAVLAGGAGINKWTAANWGNLLIAIDPARLLEGSHDHRAFAVRVNEVASRIECAPTRPGSTQPHVLLPGQRGDEAEAACLRSGFVPMAESLWKNLQLQVAAAESPPISPRL